MTANDWAGLTFFTPEEFSRPESMNVELMKMLDSARSIAGFPFVITSSYREGDDGEHGRGLAVDFRIRGAAQREIAMLACHKAGFKRLGMYNKHIHAGVDHTLPLGWWSGESK